MTDDKFHRELSGLTIRCKCGHSRGSHGTESPHPCMLLSGTTTACRCTSFVQLITDEDRLNWLSADPIELDWVRGRVNNEGVSVRDAIDHFMKIRPSR